MGRFTSTNQDQAGVAVRYSSSADTCYVGWLRRNASVTYRITKFVAGAETVLVSQSTTAPTDGSVLRLEVSGTTLTLFYNAVQVATITDATISGGTRGGLFGDPSGGNRIRFNNFEVGDLGGGAITGTAAATQAAQTSTASGTYTPAEVTGTSTTTQAAQTSTASGTFTPSGVSGSVAVTQADQTSTASGSYTFTVTGTVAVTQDNQFATTGVVVPTPAERVIVAAALPRAVRVAAEVRTVTVAGDSRMVRAPALVSEEV
jgi:hypothetical protein